MIKTSTRAERRRAAKVSKPIVQAARTSTRWLMPTKAQRKQMKKSERPVNEQQLDGYSFILGLINKGIRLNTRTQ